MRRAGAWPGRLGTDSGEEAGVWVADVRQRHADGVDLQAVHSVAEVAASRLQHGLNGLAWSPSQRPTVQIAPQSPSLHGNKSSAQTPHAHRASSSLRSPPTGASAREARRLAGHCPGGRATSGDAECARRGSHHIAGLLGVGPTAAVAVGHASQCLAQAGVRHRVRFQLRDCERRVEDVSRMCCTSGHCAARGGVAVRENAARGGVAFREKARRDNSRRSAYGQLNSTRGRAPSLRPPPTSQAPTA